MENTQTKQTQHINNNLIEKSLPEDLLNLLIKEGASLEDLAGNTFHLDEKRPDKNSINIEHTQGDQYLVMHNYNGEFNYHTLSKEDKSQLDLYHIKNRLYKTLQ